MESPLLEQRPPGDCAPPAATATLEADGFGAAVDAFAWEPDTTTDPPRMRLWLLSLLGPQQAVKALWVRLVRGELATMRVDDTDAREENGGPEQGVRAEALPTRVRFCALAAEGPRRWRLFAAALPASAGYHGLLVPDAALIGADRPDFLIFPRGPQEAPALHYRFLNRRQDLPLHPAWADWLWARALRSGEAAPLESRGLLTYRCTPDAQALAGDLSAAVQRGELRVPDHGTAVVPAATTRGGEG
jgi:hypothetical protein